ncbi:MAG: hypothetical protein ACI4NW_01185 [Stenotrophomonas sp.]
MPADTSAWLWLLPVLVLLSLLARVMILRQQAGHWKIAAFDGCRDLIGGSLLYGLLAPPLGLCAVLLGSMLIEWEFHPVALLMGALLSYVGGLLPALACGALAGIARPWLSRWSGTMACVLLGAALGAGWFIGMGWGSGSLRSSVVPALSGAIGALAAALIHLRHN